MSRWRWAEQGHSVPSPHAGEGQGGGYNTHCICFVSEIQQIQASVVLKALHETRFQFCALSPPPSLSLPRMGGGNRVARILANQTTCLRMDTTP